MNIKKVSTLLAIISMVTPAITSAQLSIEAVVAGEDPVVNQVMTTSADIEVAGEVNTAVDTNAALEADAELELQVNPYGEMAESGMMDDEESISIVQLQLTQEGVAVTSSSQVASESDLKVFTANVAANTPAVTKVDISDDTNTDTEVAVSAKHAGKFLGFIPVMLTSKTVVTARAGTDMTVRSTLPWWSFLVTQKSHAQADIESRIKSNTSVQANAQVNASATAKARVAEAIIAEITAQANLEASVE